MGIILGSAVTCVDILYDEISSPDNTNLDDVSFFILKLKFMKERKLQKHCFLFKNYIFKTEKVQVLKAVTLCLGIK